MVYYWVGYKTGLGKTNEQREKMQQDRTVCRECSGTNLQTDLDRESEVGKAYSASIEILAEVILGELSYPESAFERGKMSDSIRCPKCNWVGRASEAKRGEEYRSASGHLCNFLDCPSCRWTLGSKVGDVLWATQSQIVRSGKE